MNTIKKLAGRPVLVADTVISVGDESISFIYDTATFEIAFAYDDSGRHRTQIFSPEYNYIKFVLFNAESSVGIYYNFNAGYFDGKALELRIYLHSISLTKDDSVARSVNFTLLYKKEASDEV